VNISLKQTIPTPQSSSVEQLAGWQVRVSVGDSQALRWGHFEPDSQAGAASHSAAPELAWQL
jgi:alpha-galactosidase